MTTTKHIKAETLHEIIRILEGVDPKVEARLKASDYMGGYENPYRMGAAIGACRAALGLD